MHFVRQDIILDAFIKVHAYVIIHLTSDIQNVTNHIHLYQKYKIFLDYTWNPKEEILFDT